MIQCALKVTRVGLLACNQPLFRFQTCTHAPCGSFLGHLYSAGGVGPVRASEVTPAGVGPCTRVESAAGVWPSTQGESLVGVWTCIVVAALENALSCDPPPWPLYSWMRKTIPSGGSIEMLCVCLPRFVSVTLWLFRVADDMGFSCLHLPETPMLHVGRSG